MNDKYIFCTDCGNKCLEEDAFCRKCGSKLYGIIEDNANYEEKNIEYQQEPIDINLNCIGKKIIINLNALILT